MRVVITGACGLLGAHFMAGLSRDHQVRGLDRHPWWGDEPLDVTQGDLQDPAFCEGTLRAAEPEVLIHCAALTNVDACDRDPALAHAMNADMTRSVVRAAGPRCLIVYISSDGVFAGTRAFATEQDPPCPVTVYGQSKIDGEREVAQATENHLIIRTNFYGWSSGRKRTFGEWLYHALAAQEPVTLFDDFFFTPLYVVELVHRVRRLLDGAFRGLVHVAGRDRLSKYAFGQLMAEVGGLSMVQVQRTTTEAAPMTVRRPNDMSLSSERFAQLTGLAAPEHRGGLQQFLSDRERPLSRRFDQDP